MEVIIGVVLIALSIACVIVAYRKKVPLHSDADGKVYEPPVSEQRYKLQLCAMLFAFVAFELLFGIAWGLCGIAAVILLIKLLAFLRKKSKRVAETRLKS